MSSGPAICSWTRATVATGVNLAAVSPELQRLDVFARGADGKLIHAWYVGSEDWHPWETLHDDQIAGDPAAACWEIGRIDVVARGAGNACLHTWYDRGWYPWESLGGELTSDPTICSPARGRIDVFGRGTDSRLWHRWYVDGEGWYDWEALGPSDAIGDGVDATNWNAGRL
ncbi:MAG: carbohydrate-binding protein, partial [Acidimicrobiia bacterium]